MPAPEKVRKNGRPKLYKLEVQLSIKFEKALYEHVREIAELQTAYQGKQVSAHELIRLAVRYVYEDGERLRECFRRERKRRKKFFKTW